MNTATFPTPLLRLILCGGGGLPPADGRLVKDGQVYWPWDPGRRFVLMYDDSPAGISYWREYPIQSPESWSLPLDDTSPWPARLALVAAWMVGLHQGAGHAEIVQGKIHARGAFSRDENESVSIEWWMFGVNRIASWDCRDGLNYRYMAGQIYDISTLPQHLQTHPPVAALPLALVDVPEIRARVESL